jgi:hypothetical protein
MGMNTSGTTKKTGKILDCKFCGADYYCEPYRLLTSKFCSRICGNKYLAIQKIGKIVSKVTRAKISKAVSKPKLKKVCLGCKQSFVVKHQHWFRKYCSKECSVKNKPIWNLGKKLSKEHLQKITGVNANNWQGGKATEAQIIRHRREYREWRKAVYERDNYTCQECHARSAKGVPVILNAHHIKPFSRYPELVYSVDNGVTLCRSCHLLTDTYGAKILQTNIINI